MPTSCQKGAQQVHEPGALGGKGGIRGGMYSCDGKRLRGTRSVDRLAQPYFTVLQKINVIPCPSAPENSSADDGKRFRGTRSVDRFALPYFPF